MPDYLFFPAVIAAFAAMIVLAIAPGPERRREAMEALGNPQTGVRLEGDSLANFQIPEGLSLDLVELEDGLPAARLAAFKDHDDPPLSAGIFLTLTPEYESVFAGRRVRVTLTARRAPADGSPHFLLGYFGGENQPDIGWTDIAADEFMRDYVVEWDVPPLGADPGVDHIGLWPDPEGLGRAIEITALRVEIVDPLEPLELRG